MKSYFIDVVSYCLEDVIIVSILYFFSFFFISKELNKDTQNFYAKCN